jgi:hypothetical protein
MAKSRYSDTPILDGKAFKSFLLPKRAAGLANVNLLDGVKTTEYVYKVGDRLDHLAARFFGEDQYWWVIALVNDINYPFASGGLVPGRVLRIPSSVQDVLNKLLR